MNRTSEADSGSDLRSGLLDNGRTDGLTKKVLLNRQILQLGQRARAHTAISTFSLGVVMAVA